MLKEIKVKKEEGAARVDVTKREGDERERNKSEEGEAEEMSVMKIRLSG